MTTTSNTGEALKNTIKGTEKRVTEKYLLKTLKEKQEKNPHDYVEILGLLLTPLYGAIELFTLEEAYDDIVALTMELLQDKSRLKVANRPSFPHTIEALYTLLRRLRALTDEGNDHTFTIANLYTARRWDELTPSEKRNMLELYGAGDNGDYVSEEEMPADNR